jgi:hypothetical protein
MRFKRYKIRTYCYFHLFHLISQGHLAQYKKLALRYQNYSSIWRKLQPIPWKMANEGYLPPDLGYATRAVHACQSPDQWASKSVTTPVFTSAVFKMEGTDYSTVRVLFFAFNIYKKK